MNKFKFLLTLLLISVFSLALASPVMAQADIDPDWYWSGGDEDVDVRGTLQLGDRDPREIAAGIINIVLGFLGILAVVIILLGGFKWMTAGGNQDRVDEAKKLIMAGVIGLIIILASFGMASFILRSLVSVTAGV